MAGRSLNALRSLAVASLLSLAGRALGAQAIVPAEMPGTWQVVAIRNLATGTVDSIATRRTMWLMVTATRWTYVWMDHGRIAPSADSLQRLAPEARRRANYAKIWDDDDQPRFWASGGSYHLEGNRFVIARAMSIEPAQEHARSFDEIVQLDHDWYVYRTRDRNGVTREWVHRRID